MNMHIMEPIPGSQFITITLPPRAYKFNAQKQYDKVKDIVFQIMATHSNQFCLVAELTKQANVHFHGWFTERYENSTVILLDVFKSAPLGFVKVNDERIHDVKRTYEYMQKDVAQTLKLIKKIVISSKLRVESVPTPLTASCVAESIDYKRAECETNCC